MNYHVQIKNRRVTYCRASTARMGEPMQDSYLTFSGEYRWWGEADTQETAIQQATAAAKRVMR